MMKMMKGDTVQPVMGHGPSN